MTRRIKKGSGFLASVTLLLASAGCSDSGSGPSTQGLAVLPDTDRDGLPDRLEADLGSDPADPDSPFQYGDSDSNDTWGPGPDALSDGLELYLTQSGATPPVTAATDTDGDGVPDHAEVATGLDFLDADEPHLEGYKDIDSHGGPSGDGISDGLETFLVQRGALRPVGPETDSDRDGIVDHLELRSGTRPFDGLDPAFGQTFDIDGDGLPDYLEIATRSDPLNDDHPFYEGSRDNDGGDLGFDGDGITDALESHLIGGGGSAPITTFSDTDADGIPDAVEVRSGWNPFSADHPVVAGADDVDNSSGPAGDSISDALEIVLIRHGARAPIDVSTETDGDRLPDFVEVQIGSNPFEFRLPTPFGHSDVDGDGVPDFVEVLVAFDSLDPNSPVPDGGLDVIDATGPPSDPISDAMEFVLIALGSSAPVTTISDSDGDGVPDLIESLFASDLSDPNSPVPFGSSDLVDDSGPTGDGVSDALETVLMTLGAEAPITYATNSDDDGVPDVPELLTATNPLNAADPSPNSHADIDGDGGPDYLELIVGSSPLSEDDPVPNGGSDSDSDRLSDALEQLLVDLGAAPPVEPMSDTDGDGLFDYLEVRMPSDAFDIDKPVHGGGDEDNATGPGGDAVSDALELYLWVSGARAPVTNRTDSDGDSVPDYIEAMLVYDAFDRDEPLPEGHQDSDNDLVSDSLELVLVLLGASSPVDARTDSDMDGAPDYLEVLAGSDPFDENSPAPGGAGDSDLDGITDGLESVLVELGADAPLAPRTDSDVDGVPDYYEVAFGSHPFDEHHPLANGSLDLNDVTGPSWDTITDSLELVLIELGASAPVGHLSDTDVDGAPDYLEVLANASPFDEDDPMAGGLDDSDLDQMSAALEVVLERLGAVSPLGLRSDSDSDGAPDYFECKAAAHPVDPDDPVALGSSASFDSVAETGPNGDGVSDALELLLMRMGASPPVAAWTETDGDGIPDYFEVGIGSDPFDEDSPVDGGGADTDDSTGPGGDGISDALEHSLIAQGARAPITTATDSDGDGVPDYLEILMGLDPFDPTSSTSAGSAPEARDVVVLGAPIGDAILTGSYDYFDPDGDPEGGSLYRWSRNGRPIPGEASRTHVVTARDLGTVLSFEVTPVSLFSYPASARVGATASTNIYIEPGVGGQPTLPVCDEVESGWPQIGFNSAATSYNPNETEIDRTNVGDLDITWSRSTPCSIRIGVSVVGDMAYYGHYCSEFLAVDADTGSVIWTKSLDGKHQGHAVVDGVAYVTGRYGGVYALDALTGQDLWQWDGGGSDFGGVVISEGVLLVTSGDPDELHALDIGTGTEIWNVSPRQRATISRGVVYGTMEDRLQAFDLHTGSALWSTVVDEGTNLSRPAIDCDRIYVHSDGGRLHALNTNGVPLWMGQTLPSAAEGPQAPATGEGIVYVGSNNLLFAFDAAGCGESPCLPLWTADTGCDFFTGFAPSIANGVVYSTCGNSDLFAFDAATGEILWNYYSAGSGYPLRSQPTVVDGKVYHCATFSFTLFVFDLPQTLQIGASATTRNGSGINSPCFPYLTLPKLGTSWDSLVTHAHHPGTSLTMILGYERGASCRVLPAGEVLLDLTTKRLFTHRLFSSSSTADLHSIPVPNDAGLAGVSIATQALILGGNGPELCNAIDLIIGY